MKYLFITLGDPYSVNISAVCKVLSENKFSDSNSISIVLIGARVYFERQGSKEVQKNVKYIHSLSEINEAGLYFIDVFESQFVETESNLSAKVRGKIALDALYFLKSIPEDIMKKSAVLTSPIDKNACTLSGFEFSGHTEYFESIWKQKGIMILAGTKLKVGLVTNHLALKDVSDVISKDLICEKANRFLQSLKRDFRIKNPKIAVCSLNPHCGDGGMFGREEIEVIAPAMKHLKSVYPQNFFGMFPADTVFFRAYQGQFDGVLAMYHDQGLGPLKTVHFYDAINLTGGLPYLRVSPDHGPAKDLFGSDTENIESFKNAYQSCTRYLSEI